MKKLIAACMAVFATSAFAHEFGPKYSLVKGFGIAPVPHEKSASATTLGSRATANLNATVYGGFELAAGTRVYILVRGYSLALLQFTDLYLDAPRLRIFNASGQDIYAQDGYPGFTGCSSTAPTDAPVVAYYAARGAPVSQYDSCIAADFPAGVYTFTVTPSLAGLSAPISSVQYGEILFEVKLGP